MKELREQLISILILFMPFKYLKKYGNDAYLEAMADKVINVFQSYIKGKETVLNDAIFEFLSDKKSIPEFAKDIINILIGDEK